MTPGSNPGAPTEKKKRNTKVVRFFFSVGAPGFERIGVGKGIPFPCRKAARPRALETEGFQKLFRARLLWSAREKFVRFPDSELFV